MPRRKSVPAPLLRQAAEVLETYARHTDFLPSYARMNPRAGLDCNVFYFGKMDEPPRIVLFGPYLYVHAPGTKLPSGIEHVNEKLRRSKHLGALHARIRIPDDPSLKLVTAVAKHLAAVVAKS